MRYKIVQLASGQVSVLKQVDPKKCKTAMGFLSGWEDVGELFLCWEHAEKFILGQKETKDMARVVREHEYEV